MTCTDSHIGATHPISDFSVLHGAMCVLFIGCSSDPQNVDSTGIEAFHTIRILFIPLVLSSSRSAVAARTFSTFLSIVSPPTFGLCVRVLSGLFPRVSTCGCVWCHHDKMNPKKNLRVTRVSYHVTPHNGQKYTRSRFEE